MLYMPTRSMKFQCVLQMCLNKRVCMHSDCVSSKFLRIMLERSSMFYLKLVRLFEGVCLDSHHPDHRRAWKGGSEPHFLTPLPVDPRDPPDPRMNSKSRILYAFLQQKMLGPHSGAMFFSTFSYPFSSKTPIFDSFFGRWPARNAFKTRCFS